MNMLKNIGLVLCGVLAGSGITFLVVKKHYQNEYERQIEEMQDYYGRADEYARVPKKEKDEDVEDRSEEGIQDNDIRKAAKCAIKKNGHDFTDYSKCYGDMEKYKEAPEMTEEEKDEERNKEALQICEAYEAQRDLPPEAVDESALGDIHTCGDSVLMYYYAYDETFTDENCEEIIDWERFLGNVPEETGFIDDETKYLFVWNHSLNAVYEIEKIFASYGEEKQEEIISYERESD